LRNILCQPASGFFNKYSPCEPSWLSSVLTTLCLVGEYLQASVLECWCTCTLYTTFSIGVCVYVNTSRLQDHAVSLVYITFSLGVCVYVNTSRLQDHSVSLVYITFSIGVCVREYLTSPGSVWQCLRCILVQGMRPSGIAVSPAHT